MIERKITSSGKLNYFIGNQVYIMGENERVHCLPQSDTTKIFVFTENNKILVIDDQLNVDKILDEEKLHICYLEMNHYKFVAKENTTWIINNEGQRIAEIEASPESFLIGKTLYHQQENSIIAIDLGEIIKEDDFSMN